MISLPRKRRYHRIDGWRGYYVPRLAIVGASYTGEWEDSPCKGVDLALEINRFRREVLRPLNIKSTGIWGESSNVFCQKRWVCVAEVDFIRAAEATVEWMRENDRSLKLLHDADLNQLLMKEAA
jgi:hypothetical protein